MASLTAPHLVARRRLGDQRPDPLQRDRLADDFGPRAPIRTNTCRPGNAGERPVDELDLGQPLDRRHRVPARHDQAQRIAVLDGRAARRSSHRPAARPRRTCRRRCRRLRSKSRFRPPVDGCRRRRRGTPPRGRAVDAGPIQTSASGTPVHSAVLTAPRCHFSPSTADSIIDRPLPAHSSVTTRSATDVLEVAQLEAERPLDEAANRQPEGSRVELGIWKWLRT